MPRTTFDITCIQQINLFFKVTGVRAQNCFNYSNFILFVVDPDFFNKAIGKSGENVRRLEYLLKKRIKVIRTPTQDIERFIKVIVYPLKFKKLAIEDGNITITAGQQSKASLIGRDHSRLNELIEIVKQYFNIKGIRIA
jgi:NusA-like KH domain protein